MDRRNFLKGVAVSPLAVINAKDKVKTRHRKVFKSDGCYLYCGDKVVEASDIFETNWFTASCSECGMTVMTTGTNAENSSVIEREE